jgi:hypothetical protein
MAQLAKHIAYIYPQTESLKFFLGMTIVLVLAMNLFPPVQTLPKPHMIEQIQHMNVYYQIQYKFNTQHAARPSHRPWPLVASWYSAPMLVTVGMSTGAGPKLHTEGSNTFPPFGQLPWGSE